MGFADVLRLQGDATEHLVPRGRGGHTESGPHPGWLVSLGMLVPGSKNLSAEEAVGGTDEHVEVLTGCDLRRRSNWEARQSQAQLSLSVPVSACDSGPSYSTTEVLLGAPLRYKGTSFPISPRKRLKAIPTSLVQASIVQSPRATTQH